MPPKRVLLLIERHVGYRLSVLRGIFQYARKSGHWIIQGSELRPETSEMLRRLRPQPDGIIGGFWHQDLARELSKLDLPIVDIFDWQYDPPLTRVMLDNFALGEMAANYFLSCGFREVAFLGHPTLRFSVERRRGFESAMAANNVIVRVAPPRCSEGDVWPTAHHTARRGPLMRWVRELPKPIAVFCASDGWATQITDVCHLLNLEVPDQIAVLGVDNDELLCPLSRPPLSSIDTAAERIGFQARRVARPHDGRASCPRRDIGVARDDHRAAKHQRAADHRPGRGDGAPLHPRECCPTDANRANCRARCDAPAHLAAEVSRTGRSRPVRRSRALPGWSRPSGCLPTPTCRSRRLPAAAGSPAASAFPALSASAPALPPASIGGNSSAALPDSSQFGLHYFLSRYFGSGPG